MKRKGDLIFWEISEVTTTKQRLSELGFDNFIPRNDYKSAMIKALRAFTKGNEKLYRRHSETPESVSFTVFIENEDMGDLNLSKELTVKIDKDTGSITLSGANDHVSESLINSYRECHSTIDANQLRAMVLKIVKNDLVGIPMRKGGGIYFIDASSDDRRKRLNDLFAAFSEMTLRSVPIYDDASTVEALEQVVSDNIFEDIEAMIKDIDSRFRDGSITKRQLEGDKTKAEDLSAKILFHYENLNKKANEIRLKMESVAKSIDDVFTRVEAGIIEPDDFMRMLGDL